MTADPFKLFLGLPERSPPQALLGLWDDTDEPADVYVAYYKRLVELHLNPLGQTRRADYVRRGLRSAAKLLTSARRYRQHPTKPDAQAQLGDDFKKFIRVPEFTEPLDLLGVDPERCDAGAIDIALAQRLQLIDLHPEAGGLDAEHVRQTLQAASGLLKDETIREKLIEMRQVPVRPDPLLETETSSLPAKFTKRTAMPVSPVVPVKPVAPPRKVAPPAPRIAPRAIAAGALLTPFDRQVLAVLIGCGGWNATSRSLLVALAETYQVSPDGLVKVVKGLSDYAHSHQSRLGVQEITAGLYEEASNGPSAQALPEPLVVPAEDEASIAELEAGIPPFWNPVTLSILAAMITIILGVSLLAIIIPGVLTDTSREKDSIVELNPDEDGGDATTVLKSTTKTDGPALQRRPVRYATKPTFLGNGLPSLGADAADAGLALPEDFDVIERKISITDDPSETVFRDWAFFVDRFATGWVLLDGSTRQATEQSMLETLLLAADTPSVSDRFMQAITPPSDSLPDPIDLWRGSWKTYLLGRIASTRSMSPVVVDQAQRQLDATLRDMPADSPHTATVLARAWLKQASETMLESIEYDTRAYDFWELWLSAQRELGPGPEHDLALLNVIEHIMRGSVDLVRPGPSINIISRFLDLIDWHDRDETRGRIVAMFDDPEISTRDLWVLTSLMASRDDLEWFTPAFILPEDSDDRSRGRCRDQIHQAWPKATSASAESSLAIQGKATFDASGVQPWLDLARDVRAWPIPEDDAGRVKLLLAASLAGEAFAHLQERRAEASREALDRSREMITSLQRDVSRDLSAPRRTSNSGVIIGQPIGPDGLWSARYREVRANSNLRLELLTELSSTAGTDLGAIDAEVFVREVYRGVPEDIRIQAQQVLITRFVRGPSIAQELLDQLPGVRGQQVSNFITGLTGIVLPDVGSASWKYEARLALIEHALQLQRSGQDELDQLSDQLNESYSRRVWANRDQALEGPAPATPVEAVGQLVDAWRSAANQLMTSSNPVPDDLPGLHRRRVARFELAEGPVQRLAAEQISALELLAYILVARQPALRESVMDILNASSERRSGATHVLQQAVEIELAMLDLFRLTIEASLRGPARRQGP